ncbi:MAG: MFS transporter [Pyrinomonadaceae bacterium]
MMPLFARDVMGFDESGLALLMSAAGAGAFCGAVMLAFLGDFNRKGLLVLGGAMSFGICLVGFALSTYLPLTLGMLFGVGFSITSSVAMINVLLQQLVTDEMRGRVLSMFVLSFFRDSTLWKLFRRSRRRPLRCATTRSPQAA